jgi:hypothetical protein
MRHKCSAAAPVGPLMVLQFFPNWGKDAVPWSALQFLAHWAKRCSLGVGRQDEPAACLKTAEPVPTPTGPAADGMALVRDCSAGPAKWKRLPEPEAY